MNFLSGGGDSGGGDGGGGDLLGELGEGCRMSRQTVREASVYTSCLRFLCLSLLVSVYLAACNSDVEVELLAVHGVCSV
jgi:hypothetical protein